MKTFFLISMIVLLFFSCRKAENTSETNGLNNGIEMLEEGKDSFAGTADDGKLFKKSRSELKAELNAKGFQTFDYIDEKTQDTILMQQYFIAFLKSGPRRSQTKEEADSLQTLHLAHLQKMYELGYADISGPFGDDGEIRGITIYNVPTLKMADSLANSDPMVRSGRLIIEIHPWWAAKGFSLR